MHESESHPKRQKQFMAVTTQLKMNLEAEHRSTTTWNLSLVMGWLAIDQLGPGMQGLDLVQDSNKAQ